MPQTPVGQGLLLAIPALPQIVLHPPHPSWSRAAIWSRLRWNPIIPIDTSEHSSTVASAPSPLACGGLPLQPSHE